MNISPIPFRLRCLPVAVCALLGTFSAAGVTLEECVLEALSVHPTLEGARRRIEAARHALVEARAGWYPRLNLEAGYTRTDNPPQVFMMELKQRRLDMADPAFDPNKADDTGNVNLAAGAEYLLYDGGRRSGGVEIAEKSAGLAEFRRRAARDALVLAVVRSWYQTLQARAVLEVAEETVQSIEALLEAARDRFAAGAVVRTDVLNLEVRLAEAREQAIRARNGLHLAIAALNTAIGRERLSVESFREVSSEVEPDPMETLPPQAFRERPEWRESLLRLEIARRKWDLARSERAPRLSAFARADLDSENADEFDTSYMAGVLAEWEFFGGFQKTAAARRRRAEMLAAEADLQATENRLRFELRQAEFNARDALERIEVSESAVAGAVESLRITRERYEEGAVEVTELLMAQVGETAARTRALTARYEYCTALAMLRRARGTLAGNYLDLPPRD